MRSKSRWVKWRERSCGMWGSLSGWGPAFQRVLPAESRLRARLPAPQRRRKSMMEPQVLIVGGGMIAHDQLLPSLYHLQRQRRIGEIAVCASTHDTVRKLA